MNVLSVTNDANVLFFPFLDEQTAFGAVAGGSLSTNQIEAKKDILEIQTSKAKGTVGTFSIVLSPSSNYKALLHAGCWCMIFMSNEPLPPAKELQAKEEHGFKMLGIVRSVQRQENTDPVTGTRTVRYLVSGEDFQSVFNTQIYINANLSEIAGGEAASLAAAILVLGKEFSNVLSPSEMVQALINSLLGRPNFVADKTGSTSEQSSGARTGQPYKVPIALSKKVLGFRAAQDFFTGMLTTMLQDDLLGKNNIRPDISGLVTTWSLIQNYSHRILNEVYTDLLPINLPTTGQRLLPTIVLRAIPFSSKEAIGYHSSVIPFISDGERKVATRLAGRAASSVTKKKNELTRVPVNSLSHFYTSKQITEDEILSFNSGKTDRERFNFFFVVTNLVLDQSTEIGTLSSILSDGGLNGISDQTSVQRFGLKPFVAYSNYLLSEGGSINNSIVKIVKDLWHNAHLYESGRVSIVGQKIHIPVGTNIKFSDRGWIGHVEKCDHSFTVSPELGIKVFRTNIAFVRLQNVDGTPIEPVEDSGGTNPEPNDFDPGFSFQDFGDKK